jgi:hypothetical protein
MNDKKKGKPRKDPQAKVKRVGGIFKNKDRLADFKTSKVKRNFVGQDIFQAQKGRGFIDTTTNFQVRWTPTKLLFMVILVLIPYVSLIVITYNMGIKIVAGILSAVLIIALFIAWFVRWMDKNL